MADLCKGCLDFSSINPGRSRWRRIRQMGGRPQRVKIRINKRRIAVKEGWGKVAIPKKKDGNLLLSVLIFWNWHSVLPVCLSSWWISAGWEAALSTCLICFSACAAVCSVNYTNGHAGSILVQLKWKLNKCKASVRLDKHRNCKHDDDLPRHVCKHIRVIC